MLRSSGWQLNRFLTAAKSMSPVGVIRTGRNSWTQPERLIKYKMLYYTLGLDAQPLMRTCVLAAEKERMRFVPLRFPSQRQDPTGYRRARMRQLGMWYRRIQYQEYYLQHVFTRHAWGLLRMYPPGGAKIAGKADNGYFGYDSLPLHRYTREPLPAQAQEIYERRK